MLSAAKKHREVVWKIARLMFKAGDPEAVRRFLGIHLNLITEKPQYILGLSQAGYALKVVENYEQAHGKKVRGMTTTGQAGSPPIPKEQEKCSAPKRARKSLGEESYMGRAVRMDICQGVSRISRFLERWCPWAEVENYHRMGYIFATAGYAFHYIYCGEPWEDLFISVFSDANFGGWDKSQSGYMIVITGNAGTFIAIAWKSSFQCLSLTATGESEAVGWSNAAKAAIKFAAMK